MARLEIRLLGEPQILFDGRPVRVTAPRRCFVLVALTVLRSNATRASLAAAMWPDDLDAEARANLRRTLNRLQTALPQIEGVEWFATGGKALSWNPAAPAWVDAAAFVAASTPAERLASIDLYRGDLLEGVYEDCVLADRERLRAAAIERALEAIVTARRERRFADAIRYADRVLAIDEWREDALRLEMTVRYEAGDRSSALARFDRFAQRLRREMNVDPMPESLALRDAILANAPVPGVHGPEENGTLATHASTVFVGRQDELAVLDAAWRHAARRRGTALFLRGEPGIGKTRLAMEFAASVGAQGGRVLIGETSNPQAFPYEPLVDALRAGLPMIVESPIGDPWLGVLAELLPELHGAFPSLRAPEPLDPEKARGRLFEAVARTIEHLSRARPLLIVLEDLHWAHEATLEALEAVIRRIGAVAVLIVATYRSTEVTPAHPLRALQRKVQAERRASSLDVGALGAEDLRELVARSHGEDDALSAEIAARSEGNPLFALQLLRVVSESGELPAGERAGVDAAILSRAQALDDETTTILQTAAVVGRAFTADFLAAVLGWSEGRVFDALGSLLDRGLVRSSTSSAFGFSFAHALIEKTVYDAVPEKERTVRHRRIADVMAQQSGSDVASLATIARHWRLGGERERAAAAYVEAARAAIAIYARGEAIEYARYALELEDDVERRFEMTHLIVKAAPAALERHRRDLEALEELAQRCGPRERFEAAFQRCAYARKVLDREGRRQAIAAALELAAGAGHAEMARALRLQAAYLGTNAEFERSAAADRQSIEHAIASGDRVAEAHARHHLFMAQQILGLRDESARNVEALRALVAQGDEPEVLREALFLDYWRAEISADADLARTTGARLIELGKRIGDEDLRARGYLLLAECKTERSDAALVAHYEKAREIFQRRGDERAVSVVEFGMALYGFQTGRAKDALDLLDRVLAVTPPGDNVVQFRGRICRVEMCLELGDYDGAMRTIGELEGMEAGAGLLRAQALVAHALTLVAVGQPERAVDLSRKALADRQSFAHLEDYYTRLIAQHVLVLVAAAMAAEAQPWATELAQRFDRNPRQPRPPTLALYALARAARAAGDEPSAAAYAKRGREWIAAELESFDGEARKAFASLSFNRALLDDSF